jgi:hypothetical protein
MKKLPYIVAVDFDGTLCENAYPEIGAPKQEIIDAVKEYKRLGWRVVLWTCRNKQDLVDAIAWCNEQGLEFDAINKNIPEVQEMFGGDTRKVFADIYIDDRNVLLKEVTNGNRDFHTGEHS